MKKLLEIDKLVKFSRKITLFSILVSLMAILASFIYGVYLHKELSKSQIYVLDKNAVSYPANKATNEFVYREPEIINQLKVFHDLFFNIDQFNYGQNIEKALNLIDDSGKNYYLTLKSDGWYNSLKLNNLVQELKIDSINVDVKKYPYSALVYGKTFVYKYGDNKNRGQKGIGISCKLYDVARTIENPHGLIISKYNIMYHEQF